MSVLGKRSPSARVDACDFPTETICYAKFSRAFRPRSNDGIIRVSVSKGGQSRAAAKVFGINLPETFATCTYATRSFGSLQTVRAKRAQNRRAYGFITSCSYARGAVFRRTPDRTECPSVKAGVILWKASAASSSAKFSFRRLRLDGAGSRLRRIGRPSAPSLENKERRWCRSTVASLVLTENTLRHRRHVWSEQARVRVEWGPKRIVRRSSQYVLWTRRRELFKYSDNDYEEREWRKKNINYLKLLTYIIREANR